MLTELPLKSLSVSVDVAEAVDGRLLTACSRHRLHILCMNHLAHPASAARDSYSGEQNTECTGLVVCNKHNTYLQVFLFCFEVLCIFLFVLCKVKCVGRVPIGSLRLHNIGFSLIL